MTLLQLIRLRLIDAAMITACIAVGIALSIGVLYLLWGGVIAFYLAV